MAGLRKISDRYYARIIYYDDNQKQHEKTISLKTKDKKRARSLLKSVEKQETAFKNGIIALDDIKPKEPSDIEAMIDDFYHHLRVTERSPKTIELYRYALETFSEIYSDQDIELLGKKDYTNFLETMKKYYPNNTTCNIRLRSIRSFLNWSNDTGRISEVPFKIKQLPTNNGKKVKYFTDKEIDMILEETKQDSELFARIYTHLKTGLRRAEIHKSELVNGFIKTYDPVKNGKERSIPINEATAKYYTIAKNGSYIDTTISSKFKKILVKLGLYENKHGKRNFHCLRNTFAVKKYAETRDIYRVKVLLGHASVKTTEKYAQFDIAELQQDFNIDRDDKDNYQGKTIDKQKGQTIEPVTDTKDQKDDSSYGGFIFEA